ncbi:helix-turn-helix protein [Halopolyspora algeriensis]|uniref:Helix-turn-helix protein n=1 Tax=Halopolyspora algeriensis TaxID=1500506 RepID=A0A368VIR0_9ACTN|nr:helix-turn-helix transcriptional regulator [Halopolyspora algeriensis]RCW39544.1 helix-turn-helix protein [Halopolyspora algeriensis]TQM56143.1 helix-turn-helix protein [Halopolyspora algeriensis]
MPQDNHLASTTVRRWQLAETLRKLREEAGFTHEQVIAEVRKGQGKWSRPKLSRIENREQGIKSSEVEQLLDVYGTEDQSLRAWLVDLARTAHTRGWLVDIRKNLPEDFHTFLSLEVALVASRQFETLLVPGLLQTPEYARTVISGINPGLAEDEIERRVSARITRQQILSRSDPPHLHVILDEGLLERPVGPASMMRRQLLHLAEASAESSNITLQVLPKAAGAIPALEGPFSILTPPDPIPDIGYAEGPGRGVYIEDRDNVRAYTLRFGILMERALSPEKSTERIEQAAQQYTRTATEGNTQ